MPLIFYRHLNAAMQITILMCENCSRKYFCDFCIFWTSKDFICKKKIFLLF